MEYIELQVTSNFSFLRGASHPEELVERAAELGYRKIGIADRNSLAGVVRAFAATKDNEIEIIPGCRLDLIDGPSLLAYPTNKPSYSLLSALLTKGNLRAEKGDCLLYKQDVYTHKTDIIFIAIPPESLDDSFSFSPLFKNLLAEYKAELGENLYLAAHYTYNGNDQKRLYRLSQLANELNVPLVATNDVHYHCSERRQLQDILTCVREKCTIHTAGYKLLPNAERFLKPREEMCRLFRQYPEALKATVTIANRCNFSLSELKYVYPQEVSPNGRTPQQELDILTWKGAEEYFGKNIPENIKTSIKYELDFISRKEYASYFLTVHDFVSFARKQKILCQGRGSAANSVVCFCLGITSVNPSKFKLLFARFMSDARDEPPDIDVDFEHERREEVMQYIFNKYGRDRAAIVATVTQLHFKGAVRDVAKAMGLSADIISRLSGAVWKYKEAHDHDRIVQQGLDPTDNQLAKVLDLTDQLMGFPRQLGQHTGGFVITQDKLSDLCPILNARMENRTCIEWNKDDIETLGFLKVDVLALGMLTCIRKAFDLAEKHYQLNLTLANIPQDDPKVYEMISRADTLGVFQIESRAQMSMLPRLKPKCFYDLVIEVAIVRPGPIQGDMVHPYLRRRNGEEKVEYPSKELEEILGRTLGVPLFQEQAMEISIVAAGFSPSEADQLRRSMATFKAKGQVSKFQQKIVDGMTARGYSEEFAKRVFSQLEGFGGYGFPESHAASFALLVYVSSWLKCYYPDVFATALLNSMPMGFYQPAQIVIDAKNHDVEVLEADVNFSEWDNLLETKTTKYYSVRLGFRQIKGLKAEEAGLLIANRKNGYETITQIIDAGVAISTLEILADADAFRSLGLDRRKALWEISALADRPTSLFEGQPSETRFEPQIMLPLMSLAEHVVEDYAATSLSLKAHPVSFLREKLDLLHITSTAKLKDKTNGDRIKVAGLITVRQHPATAKGVLFITIEDESGFANLVVWESIFKKFRKEILQSRFLMVEGKVQIEGSVLHVIVSKCFNFDKLLNQLSGQKHAAILLSRADETYISNAGGKEVFHRGRNFK